MTDIYAQDTCQMRYHLVHMVVEKMPNLESVEQTVELLEAMSTYIKGGNPIVEDEDDNSHGPGPTDALDPRGYI